MIRYKMGVYPIGYISQRDKKKFSQLRVKTQGSSHKSFFIQLSIYCRYKSKSAKV